MPSRRAPTGLPWEREQVIKSAQRNSAPGDDLPPPQTVSYVQMAFHISISPTVMHSGNFNLGCSGKASLSALPLHRALLPAAPRAGTRRESPESPARTNEKIPPCWVSRARPSWDTNPLCVQLISSCCHDKWSEWREPGLAPSRGTNPPVVAHTAPEASLREC